MAAPQRPVFPKTVWSRRLRSQLPVLAVGARAVIVCPNTPRRLVTLTDANGTSFVGTVAEGAEVEIIAWQTGGRVGRRYQVRSSDRTVEGWLSAAYLRAS